MEKHTHSGTVDTPLGPLVLSEQEGKLVAVIFSDEPVVTTDTPLLREASSQLKAYFTGSLRRFDLPVAPSGTAFQQQVWQALTNIPFGRTASYLDIAHALGNTKSTRAVGAANGDNPIAIILPCHRVIGSNGTLTGYAGGLWRKQWLLQHEARVAHGVQELF